jgi:thiol-disulfide isomerase/thioredoxin
MLTSNWAQAKIPVDIISKTQRSFGELLVAKSSIKDEEKLKGLAIQLVKEKTPLTSVEMTAELVYINNPTESIKELELIVVNTGLGQWCGGCLKLKEEMKSIKNELGVKITKQDVIIAEQGVIIAEQSVSIDNLVSTVSDMSTELKPLRLRQLIEEGRKYFWKKYGPGYSTKYSDKLDSGSYYDFDSETYVDHTSPKQWAHFVTYAKNISGNAIYWKLLVGGGQSEFATLSDTVHSADAYTIARIIVKVEPLPAYKELFHKIFEMSVDQALAKGS